MTIVACVLALLACALHVFIFWLESFAWTTRGLDVFGNTPEQAQATREMAFNQGFYNLMLALVGGIGAVLLLAGHTAVGTALVIAGVGSMLAAAALLFATSPDKRSAALKQGTLPACALVALLLVHV